MSSRGSAHLLLGPEEGEKAAYVDTVVRGIAEQTGRNPDVLRYHPGVGDLPAFLDGLRTGDLFAAHRVALFTDVDRLGKREVDPLCDYLANPSKDVTVLLLSPAATLPAREAAGRLSRQVPASNRKIFWELFANQKMAFVRKFFSDRKMTLEPEAAAYLLEVVETNTRELRAECEKLALLHGSGDTIVSATIEQYVYHSREENAFTLFDRLATRSLEASLEVLHKILHSAPSEGSGILAGLLSQFRRLLEMKLLVGDGQDLEGAIEGAYIRGKRNQQSFRAAHERYSLEEVRGIISTTAQYEARLRSHRSDLQALLLSLYLYQVVCRGGLPRRPAPRQQSRAQTP